MFRLATLLVFAMSLTACDAFSTLTNGWQFAKAVETDLEASIGTKPEVGFNWHNGRLVTVTVTFPSINETKPLPALAEAVRHAVTSRFKQVPDNIVLAFSLGKSSSSKVAGLADFD
jgi:hypothetical protein